MDLHPYGIRAKLKNQQSLADIRAEDIQPASFTAGIFRQTADKADIFIFRTGHYYVTKQLGKGVYGKVFEVQEPKTSQRYAVKIQPFSSYTSFLDILNESIMNIILTKVNKHYVQNFYELGIDHRTKNLYMRIELLEGNLEDYIHSKTPGENNSIVPNCLLQIAERLAYFQKKVGMNHRDLFPNNIMYVTRNGKPELRLIDFGLSCLTYKGIFLSTSHGDFPTSHICNRAGRDLSFFILLLVLDYKKFLSPELYQELRDLITFKVHGEPVHLNKVIPDEEWNKTYNFLNRQNVENPHTAPKQLKKHIVKFTKKLEKSTKRQTRKVGIFPIL